MELIEEKTGISFGLNNRDINKKEEKYFHTRADEFDEDFERIRHVTGQPAVESKEDDMELIKNI